MVMMQKMVFCIIAIKVSFIFLMQCPIVVLLVSKILHIFVVLLKR